MVTDIQFSDKSGGGTMFIYHGDIEDVAYLSNPTEWFKVAFLYSHALTKYLVHVLTHETIHRIVSRAEGTNTSTKFDTIKELVGVGVGRLRLER